MRRPRRRRSRARAGPRGRGVLGLAVGARRAGRRPCRRRPHRRHEVRVVMQVVETGARVGERLAAPCSSSGVILRDLLDRQATVDDLQGVGIHCGGHRLAGVGEVGADVGEGARGAHVGREERQRQTSRRERCLQLVACVRERASQPGSNAPCAVIVSPSRAALSARVAASRPFCMRSTASFPASASGAVAATSHTTRSSTTIHAQPGRPPRLLEVPTATDRPRSRR